MSGDRCWSSIAATPAEHAALGDPPGASWLIVCRLVSGHSGPHASDGVTTGAGRRRWLLWSDFAQRPQSLIDHDPCPVPALDGAECIFFSGHGGAHQYPPAVEPQIAPGPAADPRPLAAGGGNPFGFADPEPHGRHEVEPEAATDLAAAQAAFNSVQGGFGGFADDEPKPTYRPGFLTTTPAEPITAPVTIGTWSGRDDAAEALVEVVNPPVRDPLAPVQLSHPMPRIMTVRPDGSIDDPHEAPRYLGSRHGRREARGDVLGGVADQGVADEVAADVMAADEVAAEVQPVLDAAHQVAAAANDAAVRLEPAPQRTARRLGASLREVAAALDGLADALDPRD